MNGEGETPLNREREDLAEGTDRSISDSWATSSNSLAGLLKKGARVSGNRMLALLAILLVSINLLGIWGIL
jgi:hypothetical protein